jgi:hypothetical protein
LFKFSNTRFFNGKQIDIPSQFIEFSPFPKQIPNFTEKNAFERPFAHYATIYSAQYALSGYGLFEGVFEYQRYCCSPNGLGH